jgi:hypothetical protein
MHWFVLLLAVGIFWYFPRLAKALVLKMRGQGFAERLSHSPSPPSSWQS